mgnify:CR=1 FL=1
MARTFRPLPAERPPAQLEAEIAHAWRAQGTFQKSLEATRDGLRFVFYEGPPTANGMPHHGHVLTRAIKDLFPRYKTMCGFHVGRKAGWDTHGLPVEIEVEKTLGLDGKRDVERYGIGPFVQQCKESVWKYKAEWERMTERVGFWIDLQDPYVTYDPAYVQSVWWALQQLHAQGLLYKGHKVLPWCPRDMTGLSSGEVSEDTYQEVNDPAITVAFALRDDPQGAALLAWTTTPWTLLSNVALAVHPEVEYAWVRHQERTFVLASARVEATLGKQGVEVLRTAPGAALLGRAYEPLYRFVSLDAPAHVVVAGDFVTTSDGTGVVHCAPAYGEDDQRVCRENRLAFQALVGADGRVAPEAGPFAGKWFKEVDKDVRRDLRERGLLVQDGQLLHKYPHCWRCKTPLMYFARSAWFIETTRQKERLVELNRQIGWLPEHIKEGRFGGFLQGNKDWALSRERYWGTPLPVWDCTAEGCDGRVVVGSLAELRQKNPALPADLDPHRPAIDEVTVPCPRCGGTARRVPEVIDCWFDSGSMPFAQWGYPHAEGSVQRFGQQAQADFISEAIDQTRGWFYTLHAISTLLFDRPAYQHCLVLGHVLNEQGKKLSKRDKNYRPPEQILDEHGADALRWFFYSKMTPGQGVRYSDEAVRDARRTFLLKVLHVYGFFQEYASGDGFDPCATPRPAPGEREPLDRWILSSLHSTTAAVRAHLDGWDYNRAAVALEELVDGLSNWYLRRCRPRGWSAVAGASPAELASKWAFWWTTWEVLAELSKLLAPFTPFLAEALHGALVREPGVPGAAESVHLERYPQPERALIDPALEARMALARRAVALGLSVRKSTGGEIAAVRQPLQRAVVLLSSPQEEADLRALAEVVADELNVKSVEVSHDHDTYVTFEVKPNFQTLGKRLGKRMGAAQKALKALDPRQVAADARAGRSVRLSLDGGEETLSAEDLDVRLTAREGFAAAGEGSIVVVLDRVVTPALRREGLARELQSKVQARRKELGLPYAAKIEVWVQGATGELVGALEGHGEAIARETLAVRIMQGIVPEGVESQAVRAGDEEVMLGLRVVQ